MADPSWERASLPLSFVLPVSQSRHSTLEGDNMVIIIHQMAFAAVSRLLPIFPLPACSRSCNSGTLISCEALHYILVSQVAPILSFPLSPSNALFIDGYHSREVCSANTFETVKGFMVMLPRKKKKSRKPPDAGDLNSKCFVRNPHFTRTNIITSTLTKRVEELS